MKKRMGKKSHKQGGKHTCYYDGIMCREVEATLLVTGEYGYSQQTPRGFIAGIRTQMREGGVAQLCNDAATDYDEQDLKYLKHINVKEEYYSDDFGVVFVATKPIKKGAELLYSYGSDYWEIRKLRLAHTIVEHNLPGPPPAVSSPIASATAKYYFTGTAVEFLKIRLSHHLEHTLKETDECSRSAAVEALCHTYSCFEDELARVLFLTVVFSHTSKQ